MLELKPQPCYDERNGLIIWSKVGIRLFIVYQQQTSVFRPAGYDSAHLLPVKADVWNVHIWSCFSELTGGKSSWRFGFSFRRQPWCSTSKPFIRLDEGGGYQPDLQAKSDLWNLLFMENFLLFLLDLFIDIILIPPPPPPNTVTLSSEAVATVWAPHVVVIVVASV